MHNGAFRNLFPVWAIGTENLSYHQPRRSALWPVDRKHRLHNLLCAIHPSAQFFNPVLSNNSYLIFIAVVVRHLLSPQRRIDSDLPEEFHNSSRPRSAAWQVDFRVCAQGR